MPVFSAVVKGVAQIGFHHQASESAWIYFSLGGGERELFLKNDWQRRDIKHPVKIWRSCWLHMDAKVKSTDDVQNTGFHFILKKNDITMPFSFSLSLPVSIIVSLTFSQKKTDSFSLYPSLCLSLCKNDVLSDVREKRATQGLSLFFPSLLLISNVTTSLWSVVTIDAGNSQTDVHDIPEKH